MRDGKDYVLASACNSILTCDDIISEGDASEVTCKRCKKILERADENGKVILK